MYEKKKDKVISPGKFFIRLLFHVLIVAILVVISLVIGMFGYSYFEHMSLIDAFLNASMILSGMGPVNVLKETSGKLFASFYAIYCGLLFVSILAILLLPIFHRILHKFHISEK